MPKVTWCRTAAAKRDIAAKELVGRIEAARIAAGMSAQELSAASDVSYATYRRRRLAPTEMTVGEIQRIASVLSLNRSEDFKAAFLSLISTN